MSSNPYKDADNKNRVVPGRKQEPVPTVKTEEVVAEPPKAIAPQTNPLMGMIEPKPTGKSYGLYLSEEAAEKLEKLAKQNKCSKSKALDALLRSL